ncbi:MAG: two pore domain potassium channel family protein [Acidobacteria bacterium]|nr:two pore domain potassium channel family protein [Acidobacteriota bacterium]
MGYTDVRHYAGGLADWKASGESIESGAAAAPRRVSAAAIDLLAERTIGGLFALWFAVILAFGVLYWLADTWHGHGLLAGSNPVDASIEGFLQALYFSFVTALSIGYGDVVPVGPARPLAIAEGAAGLIIFGCVISKLVSRKQEDMVEEIHRIAFEDRLGRVRSNLHLVLSELQQIAGACEGRTVDPVRMMARIESATTVFVGELRTVHDLLYRPQQVPDEEVLESILASLAAGLNELADLLASQRELKRSAPFSSTLRSVSTLAEEICGECVPRSHAPSLKSWMDRVQALSRSLA